jgi:hypothetical protein
MSRPRFLFVHRAEHEWHRRRGTSASLLTECWDGQVPASAVRPAMRNAPAAQWCPYCMPEADAAALRSLRMEVLRARRGPEA